MISDLSIGTCRLTSRPGAEARGLDVALVRPPAGERARPAGFTRRALPVHPPAQAPDGRQVPQVPVERDVRT